MVKPEKSVLDAWLASAELPYDWLIPLLHDAGGSDEVYTEFISRHQSILRMIPDSCTDRLRAAADESRLAFFRTQMEKHDIHTLTILEEAYPPQLRDLTDPPGILFYQGSLKCLENRKKVSMVGSRAASYAGLKAARKIALELSRCGVSVISGLAYGIDAECHRGCIEGGSPTIAVMGCGLDQTYPAQNASLKNDIISRGGLILSEYAPGTKPIGHHFPYRNRIISGLSETVILVEAKIRSGSMTTIGHALNQGKDVYVYPGDPTSPMSEGNRMLLREGARYFTEAKEILSDMDWLDNMPHVGQNIGCSAGSVPVNASEAAVIKALEKGELGFDQLLQITGLKPPELMSTLTMMQIRKLIEPIPGKRYQIIQ